ncbi:translesion error-prone DNA polymerase V autoproteolytic subunit [Leucobacter sp. UCMA 4100]|nr:translesion error-prone DNA polymerase V autoproteolytic subunit [Leucobacter sp. UCMA 4100]
MGRNETCGIALVSGVRQAPRRVPLREAFEAVPAGWPSAAQDYYSGEIDLNEHLISDPAATYIVRVAGDSMVGAGISDGDELIVDRSKEPQYGDVVIAMLDGDLTVKRLQRTEAGVVLCAANPRYPDIIVEELSELRIWGVVTRCLHHVR